MIHPWHDVTPGDKLPQEFDSVIEIPYGASVKYELDKISGLIRLDRLAFQLFVILKKSAQHDEAMRRHL